MSPAQLNDSIPLFVFEVQNKDGSEYPANSVHGLVVLYTDIKILDTVCIGRCIEYSGGLVQFSGHQLAAFCFLNNAGSLRHFWREI